MRDAAIAHRRFGLGARPGDIQRLTGDARAAVLAQLQNASAALLPIQLRAGHEILAEIQSARDDRRAVRAALQAKAKGAAGEVSATGGSTFSSQAGGTGVGTVAGPAPSAEPPPRGAAVGGNPSAGPAAANEPRPARLQREAFQEDLAARISHSIATDAPFVERLVLFWSGHFAVSAAKGQVRGLVGAFEREAIRPLVLGRFGDMLKSVVQHPAMLIYLDNAQSIGPGSVVGQRRSRGLNENLAREILELHTLGVDGGYAQADVTAFARLLTGWTVGQIELEHTEPGKFFFAQPRHEPGGATLLGKRYTQGGVAEGEAVLADLAKHSATARHIARKLARHFVADAAPPALIAALERAFLETGGDLKAVAETLVRHDAAWAQPPTKIIPPYDFLISVVRGVAPSLPPQQIHRLAAALGQPTWTPASPKGWPDDDEAWTGPAAIRERLRIAEAVARRAPVAADPRRLTAELLGGLAGEATRQAIDRAETREQGLELLVMAPEFLRR